MIALRPCPQKALRNWTIASIIALTVSLAPIVRSDTLKLLRTVFAGRSPTQIVRADLAK
jgi:hypothetical protein